jgi:hypothetical protein
MLKPNKTFRLSKTVKRMIALMKGSTAEQRNQYKRMMIDAELCAAVQPKREKSSKPTGNFTPPVSE